MIIPKQGVASPSELAAPLGVVGAVEFWKEFSRFHGIERAGKKYVYI